MPMRDISAPVVFYRSADAFMVLQVGTVTEAGEPYDLSPKLRAALELEIGKITSTPGEWPTQRGLFVCYFWHPREELWHFVGGKRATVQELARIHDGTWS